MFWSGIKSIVKGKAKSRLSQISYLLNNGKGIDDRVKMANIFNPISHGGGGQILPAFRLSSL